MRLALVTLAALRCRAAAPQSRWRPYLDAGTPIKPSQCVLRFVNVPASAVDANAPPSADVYAKWRGDGEVEGAGGEDGDGTKSALRVGASEVYSESVGETERRRRDQSARLENSHASHWAALAGNARAITGDAPR